MSDSHDQLERENRVVLAGVQALLGLISHDVVAIGFDVQPERIVLRYWVKIPSPETDADMADALSELDGLLSSSDAAALELDCQVGNPDPHIWSQSGLRMVYGVKELRPFR